MDNIHTDAAAAAAEVKGKGTAAANEPSQRSNDSSQNQYSVISGNDNGFGTKNYNNFITHNHSITCAYSYDPAQVAQVNANTNIVQVGCPPFVDYSHNHNQGRGPLYPYLWHNHQQSAAFAGYYDYGTPELQPFQPQPWPQPQPQPPLPAINQLGLVHSHNHNAGGVGSSDSIVVKLCPSQDPSTSPGPIGGPSTPTLEPWLQQRQRSHSAPPHLELELNQQQRQQQQQQEHLHPARTPSALPPPYLAPHGEHIPLLLSVHKLRNDETLKALIDKEDLLIVMNDCGTRNQMSRGYPCPASTLNQSPPPHGTVADASACQGEEKGEVGTGAGSYRYPAAAAAVARPKKDLFIFHVPNDMTEGELYKLFSQFGKLRRARIHHEIIDGKSVSRGYGFVTFKRFSDAVVAVHSLNGYKVGGKSKNKKALVVTYCRDTPRPSWSN